MNNYYIDIGFVCEFTREEMNDESKDPVTERVKKIGEILAQHYPGSTCELVDHGELATGEDQ